MASSFNSKAPFLGGIAGLNPPGSTGTTDSAFGGMLNVAPLTPGFTGAQPEATNPYPQGSNESMLWMMNKMQRDTEERGDLKYNTLYDKISKQRQEEAREAFGWKMLGQGLSAIQSTGQALATTLYNPASVEITSRTPGLLANIYAQDLAGARRKYIS
jgi:hypothetical protein